MDHLPQNPAILVSSVNMLLRDEEFDSLEALCYAFDQEPEQIKDIIESKDRTKAGPTAPPEGLTLLNIDWEK